MPEIEVNGKAVEVDEDGFLVSLDDWTEDVAKFLADSEGVSELTEEHWKLINYLKDYYNEYGIAPMVRKMTKESGFSHLAQLRAHAKSLVFQNQPVAYN